MTALADPLSVNRRVLIVDDNAAIHDDFRKILGSRTSDDQLRSLESQLFGAEKTDERVSFQLDFALQGQQALEMVRRAVVANEPYALAFVDMRMPPGWDGVETIHRLWEADEHLHIVMCSAYSDYSWADIVDAFGNTDRLLIMKKPFDAIEMLQCATAMVHKWSAARAARELVGNLDRLVRERTMEIEQALELFRCEMRERERVTNELRVAQKLESVGRLAAGIAHEINTPIQYVADSIEFIKSACQDLDGIMVDYRKALTSVAEGGNAAELLAQLKERETDIDMPLLVAETPRAFDRSLEGVQRVAAIVRAMKEFAHPGGSEQSLANLNHSIETTLNVARNEYKYVATVHTELGEIPEVMCNIGELNQVFLNLIVNGAHAIADAKRDPDEGRITIATRAKGTWVEIEIRDNGCGIPDSELEKIYDPFYTTKEVGRGSGQGLAIARSIVVDKHCGKIEAESKLGEGTCFRVCLPVEGIGQQVIGGAPKRQTSAALFLTDESLETGDIG